MSARPRPTPDRRAAPDSRPLPRGFFARPALRVAPDLLGRLLVHDGPGGRVSGRIVEVEAYRGSADPASHAFRGRTGRNAAMFGRPGHLYVYFTYGMHHCVNLVCEPASRPAAVLVRALEPVDGIEAMRARRGVVDVRRLARGPGCVAQALGLDRRHDGIDLLAGPVWVAGGRRIRAGRRVVRGPRIGIRTAIEKLWRFWLEGHPCVSGGGVRPASRRPPARAIAADSARRERTQG